MSGSLLLIIWFPAYLTLIGYADRVKSNNAISSSVEQTKSSQTASRIGGWQRWAIVTRAGRWPIAVICFLALVVGAVGIPKVRTGSELSNFFPVGHHVLTSAKAMESRFGPLNSVELLLQFDNADSQNDRVRLKGIQALVDCIKSETDFESCLSAGTFAPKLKRPRSGARGSVERTRLRKFKDEIVSLGLVHLDETKKQETWRVSCRFSVLSKLDLADQTEQLKRITEELFIPNGQNVFQGETLTTIVTGEFVLFDFIDSQFYKELLLTYLTAFVVITLMVLVVLRSVKLSLIALLPNLFPALVVLGTAGFLGYSLDVASLMTASVALGIAVDDTLHFLLWHQETDQREASAISEKGATIDPVCSALQYCGTAIVQTSMILGLSILLFAFCGFLPTVRFGVLLSAMMFAALVGDLLLLPALMAIGRFDRTSSQKSVVSGG